MNRLDLDLLRKLNPQERGLSLAGEFKRFAFKGNVIDMAVGVIIGGAFGKIIDAAVKHLIMPALGVVLPTEQGYLQWKIALGGKEIPYGLFLGELVNFFIIALVLFLFVVKFLGWLLRARREEHTDAPAAPSPTREEELLMEIRDLLREGRAGSERIQDPARQR